MQKDSITIGLRLAGLEVLRVQERRECIEAAPVWVVACYSNQEAVCPGCGRSTLRLRSGQAVAGTPVAPPA